MIETIEWHKYEETEDGYWAGPNEEGQYLVALKDGRVTVDDYVTVTESESICDFFDVFDDEVIAWAEMPDGYNEDKHD